MLPESMALAAVALAARALGLTNAGLGQSRRRACSARRPARRTWSLATQRSWPECAPPCESRRRQQRGSTALTLSRAGDWPGTGRGRATGGRPSASRAACSATSSSPLLRRGGAATLGRRGPVLCALARCARAWRRAALATSGPGGRAHHVRSLHVHALQRVRPSEVRRRRLW